MSTGIGIGIAGQVYDLKPGVPGGGGAGYSNEYSMYFDGVNEYLEGASVPLLGTAGTGDFSISFWIKPKSAMSSTQRLWSFGAGGSQFQTQLYITSSQLMQFQGPWSDGSTPINLTQDTWQHIVYRVNRASTSNNVGFVSNGSQVNNKNQDTSGITFDQSGSFYIGRNAGSYGYDGNLDEFALWNKYLTDAECLEIYNGGKGIDLTTVAAAANLQHWWRMGDPTGQAQYPTIPDQVGGINLTMSNMDAANIETDVP